MIHAILQARLSSSRLPGKVLKPILGRPLLSFQLERIKRSKKIDRITLATSIEKSDDAIEEFAKKEDLEIFRGDLDDVLSRFQGVLKNSNAQHVVRLTGDCPLIDWEVLDATINLHLEKNADYTSNTLIPTFPDGLDVEVIRSDIFDLMALNAKLRSEREHVTLYLHNNPGKFNMCNYSCGENLSHLRWTVDEAEDFELIKNIYENFYENNPAFLTRDILAFLNQRPTLKKMNIKYQRNEGLHKSLKRDQI